MNTRVKNRVVAGLVTAGLVGGASFAAAAPASADPGDASAIGAAVDFEVHFGSLFNYEQSNILGGVAVSDPGQDAANLTDQTLLDLGIADITLGTVSTAVESTGTIAHSAARVADASANLFGLSLVSLDVAEAAAQCPVGGTPAAVVNAAGLNILGVPVTLDEDNPGASQTTTLPASVATGNGTDTVDLSGVEVTVQVAQQAIAEPAGAIGIALAAQVLLEGTFTDADASTVTIPPATVATNLLLAFVTCETPAVAPVTPLTATGISPASGTSAGGQTVTITGTGFVAGTTVTFAGIPASNVVVAADGTSLTAVTPVGLPGSTAVVLVGNPDGSTAQLSYAYDAVPIIPAGNTTTGTTTLAATGADPAPLAAGAAGILALGLVLAAATAHRARRRSA